MQPEAALLIAVLRHLAERQTFLEPCPLQGADFIFRRDDKLPAFSVAPRRGVTAGTASDGPQTIVIAPQDRRRGVQRLEQFNELRLVPVGRVGGAIGVDHARVPFRVEGRRGGPPDRVTASPDRDGLDTGWVPPLRLV